MKIGFKWFVGMVGSSLVGLEDNLRVVGLCLGLVVSILTIAILCIDLYRRVKK